MQARLFALFFILFNLSGCFEEEPQQFVMEGHSPTARLSSLRGLNPLPPPPPMAAPSIDFVGNPSDMVLDRNQYKDRQIEETHNLTIETPRESLQTRYQQDMKRCLSMGCEIIHSNIDSQGHANIEARIAPKQLPLFLDKLSNETGKIISHQLRTNDRTMEVVDSQAQLNNQIALRDRLLKLMADKQFAKVSELLQVERELARVQSRIDSLTGQLKRLEHITQKATVSVHYQLPPRSVELKYHDIGNSLRYAWNGFLMSISTVIMFTARAVPWLPVFVIGLWLLIATIRIGFRITSARCPNLSFWRKKAENSKHSSAKKKSDKTDKK